MTKSEKRRLRKAAVARGESWTTAVSNDGAGPGFEQVRVRTSREERAHERRLERVARLVYDHNRDF